MYGLKRISAQASDKHAVVILHGIRQTRDHLATPFGEALVKLVPDKDVYVYGYDHTRELVTNGVHLADSITAKLKAERIDLVGYSMGGLVARLAASDRFIENLHTVVTIATPNRGSLGPAQLSLLGQMVLGTFRTLSPLAPGTAGVKNLTEAAKIMSDRRDRLKSQYPPSESPVAHLRFASIPALFYHPDRSEFAFGPSVQLSLAQKLVRGVGLKWQLDDMDKPHDGIVTESSSNLTRQDSFDWSEVHMAEPGQNGEPPRCHAVLDIHRHHDHGSIVAKAASETAELVAALLMSGDWRNLEAEHPALKQRLRTTWA
ncbi:triacylglycerol lipase [Pelagibius sp. Alg239-R121]|uniref:esterase/lipase family protein n=1 Tax=Pelagibius sp. Alg239-R121 TaxID=2993448 RepID=UPI0024A6F832|nr:hypothetical protein [Pelagibius sp. Alg239-R121]